MKKMKIMGIFLHYNAGIMVCIIVVTLRTIFLIARPFDDRFYIEVEGTCHISPVCKEERHKHA